MVCAQNSEVLKDQAGYIHSNHCASNGQHINNHYDHLISFPVLRLGTVGATPASDQFPHCEVKNDQERKGLNSNY
jgi:hypothetical protein